MQNRFANLAREPWLTTWNRPTPSNRFWAKVIDMVLIITLTKLLSFVTSWALVLAPLLFWSTWDRLGRGQSPGKWLLGLHTIERPEGEIIGYRKCLQRNFAFLMFTYSLWLTGFAGQALYILSTLVICVETYFVFRLRSGVRLGDVFSNTRVFDYKDEHTKFIEQFLKNP